MRNLILESVPLEEIRHALEDGLPLISGPVPSSLGDGLPQLRDAVIQRAEREIAEPMPELSGEHYALFHKTGERLSFEVRYFERRRRLGRAALAVIFSGEDSSLVASLLCKIEETMGEFSWAFPAHICSPSGMDPMKIDLFAAETANVMAELLVAFPHVIPPPLSAEIRYRLKTQFLENYLYRHQDFFWPTSPMNWNAVCHQGVLGAALTCESDSLLVARLLQIASKHLPYFLDGFCADGSTSEGPSYWQYGFGRFAELNAQLEARSGGRLSLFANDERITRIAGFAPACVLRDGHFVNFSDGPRTGILDPSLLLLLSERLPEVRIGNRAALDSLRANGLDLDAQRSDFFRLWRTFFRASLSAISREDETRDTYFPDYGAIVVHGEDDAGNYWEFAAKAGHNEEHHNHNDCGSFIINFNGLPLIVEIGAPEYTRHYFGEERYADLAARSLGHSVPVIGGVEQAAGGGYAAKVTKCFINASRVEFSMDLTKCYPASTDCANLTRGFYFDRKAGRLEVVDECTAPFETVIMTESKVDAYEGGAVIGEGGGVLYLTTTNSSVTPIVESLNYRSHEGRDRPITRLRIASADSSFIRYTLSGSR